jgi:hypothetical protein
MFVVYFYNFFKLKCVDHAPAGTEFGDCLTEPDDAMPGDTVTAVFVSGHLRYIHFTRAC